MYYEDVMKSLPPTISDMAAQHDIPHYEVESHNGETCRNVLTEIKPDLMALGNCNIIRPHIFTIARHGCVNTHPGLLPEVRGVFPVVWAVYHDHPSGVATHFVDEKLDTGPLLYNQEFPVNRGDTVEDLLEKAVYTAGAVIVRVLEAYRAGTLKAIPQEPGSGNYYSQPSREIFEMAARKLKNQTYLHFAD
jgi:methionyl-tRNA formyltransferase